MKKICFVTTISLSLKCFVLENAKYLHENCGFDISFMCSHDDEFEAELPSYIHYYPIKMRRGINLDGIYAIRHMKRIFKEQHFDLVQYSTPNASCYAAIASKLAKVPVRLYCQWGIVYVGFEGIKRKVFKAIEKTVCSLSTWIEPDSKSNLEFSQSEGLYKANKSSVVWNGSASGVSLKKYDIKKKQEYRHLIRSKYNISDDAFVFGFVGRITSDKGINELFIATQKILKSGVDAYLLLVGNSEKSASVNSELYLWATKDPRVIFCGFTNVVEQYVSAMDCYILPSYREGFGLGVVEAEAMGIPVIVTDIPGPTDAMQKDVTGMVVKKADIESLYLAMEKLRSNKTLCEQFGNSGITYATSSFEQQQLFEKIANDRETLIISAHNRLRI